MQRIAVCRTGRRYRSGLRVGMGMVDLLRDGLSSTDAVQVIAVGNVGALILLPAACAGKRPSAGPAKGPIPTVVIGGWIAASIVLELMAIKGHKQVLPVGIPISVGMGLTAVRSGQDVPRIIVGKGIKLPMPLVALVSCPWVS